MEEGNPALPLTQSLWEASSYSPREVGTIGDAARAAAGLWPGRLALVDGGDTTRRWTFGGLAADGERVGRALAAQFSPGEHVAIWAPNRPEWILLEIGAAMAGLTLVTVNPALGEQEAGYILARSDTVGIFVAPTFRGVDLPAVVGRLELPLLRAVIRLDDFGAFADSPPTDIALPEVGPGSPAQIQYTSGTTGSPKGALLTHRGLVDNGWLYATTIGAHEDDVWINPMPLFHTAGCGLATLGALQTGGCQVLVPAFDPDVVLDLIAAEHGTVILTVPTMLVRLLEAQQARPRDCRTLRLWTLGGAPVAPELVKRAQEHLGTDVAIGFGQTESSPYITHTVLRDPHPHWDQTVGRPLPQIAVRITSPGTAATLPVNQVGEICTRSACVMNGYYNDPEATAAALDDQGWLHTGDLASMDESGYVRIAGRLKELIIRGGENVYPREIEDVLHEHPAVSDVAVIGIPDPEWGEQVAAFVQASRPVGAAELVSFCRGRLASFKTPKVWHFVDEFPQTASGKIRKISLRDQLKTESRTD